MKKWEKPTIQNLALNYTQEEGVQPLWVWQSELYCCSCNIKYVPYFVGNGYVMEGNIFVTAEREPKGGNWKCGKRNNGVKCGGILQASQQCS